MLVLYKGLLEVLAALMNQVNEAECSINIVMASRVMAYKMH